jgi:peptidyl-prolyl cis-trans isomerase C
MTFGRTSVLFLPIFGLLAQTPPATQPKPAIAAGPVTITAPASKPAPAPAPVAPDKVVVTVGDEKLTAGELNKIIAALPEQYRTQANGPGRKAFIDNIVRLKVLAQEGRRRKLDQDPTYLTQLALQRDNLLAGSTYNSIAQSTKVTPEQVQQYYEQHKAEYESAKASHILVRFKGSPAPARPGQPDLTEEQALAKVQGLRKEILAGADFAAVAKRESDDAGSGAQGGDLGTFHHGQMVPQFDEAAFKSPVGEVTEPVKTNFGYHLIKVVQRDAKSLDEVRSDIESKLRPQAAMKAVESLQQSTNVIIDPQYLGEEKKAEEKKPEEKK